MRKGFRVVAVVALAAPVMLAGAVRAAEEGAGEGGQDQDTQEVIIVVTPEYADVDQPMLIVPQIMSPMDIAVEDGTGALESSYGETKKAPNGKRLPIRKSFAPELQESAMEQ